MALRKLAKILALPATALILAGCFKFNVDDEFFKAGHTYRTLDENFLLFHYSDWVWAGPHDYRNEGCLYSAEHLAHSVDQSFMSMSRRKKIVEFEEVERHNGLLIYIPAGTKFTVNKIYGTYPDYFHLMNFDITLFHDLAKNRPIGFYIPIRAQEVSVGADGPEETAIQRKNREVEAGFAAEDRWPYAWRVFTACCGFQRSWPVPNLSYTDDIGTYVEDIDKDGVLVGYVNVSDRTGILHLPGAADATAERQSKNARHPHLSIRIGKNENHGEHGGDTFAFSSSAPAVPMTVRLRPWEVYKVFYKSADLYLGGPQRTVPAATLEEAFRCGKYKTLPADEVKAEIFYE